MATVKPISIFSGSVKHSTVSLFEYEGLPGQYGVPSLCINCHFPSTRTA